MVSKIYIPDKGDVVWLNLDPTKGHEQKGRRPALVVSPRKYNAMSELSLVCPITSTIRNYPFEVPVQLSKVKGVIISDQVRSISWKVRKANLITSVPSSTLDSVTNKIRLLIS